MIKDKQVHATFFWDRRQMFKVEGVDLDPFVAVLKSWIYESSMPSKMQLEFPWLEFSKLANYYEKGRPIEGDFMESWDSIESFYEDLTINYGFKPQVSELLTQMHHAGYDRTLRAGQSLSNLILSRSGKHGLKGAEAIISFNFLRNGMNVSFRAKEEEKHHYQELSLVLPLKNLLDRLVATDIVE